MWIRVFIGWFIIFISVLSCLVPLPIEASDSAALVPVNADNPAITAKVVYVRPTGSDSNDGLNWNTAKSSIRAALEIVSAGDEVWVAAGRYNGNVVLTTDVALYGGFSGSETIITQRDWQKNHTVIDAGFQGSAVVSPAGAGNSTIIDGFIISNGFAINGGGVLCQSSSPTIRNNNIIDNSAELGAGIYCLDSSALIINNIINRNTAFAITADGGRGGGIYCSEGAPTVANNIISGNICHSREDDESGSGYGGGIYCSSSATIQSNIITGNTAMRGGGFYSTEDTSELANNTLFGNSAWYGGGIYCSSSSLRIFSNIVAFGSSGIFCESDMKPSLSNNCIYGNAAYDYSGISAGSGDLPKDPVFASVVYGRLHIQSQSPCINAGFSTGFTPEAVDIDGQMRVIGPAVDIGADESDGSSWDTNPLVVYVSTSGSDQKDGLSWQTAKRTIQAAIDTASAAGGEVWVKAGNYSEHLNVRRHVYLYGGFCGNETWRYQRKWRVRPSVIDGGGQGSVVSMASGYNHSGIDGFIIRNGDIGIDLRDSYVFVANNYITGTRSGIYCYYSSPLIAGNTITGNVTGIYCYKSSPAIRNNVIFSNGENGGWGVICDNESSPSVVNNTITANGGLFGGGVQCQDRAVPTVANNILAYNQSGISSSPDSTPVLKSNCLYQNRNYDYLGLASGDHDGAMDPLFVNALMQDYHLLSGSACINKGDTSYVKQDWLDIDGQRRIFGGSVDIGADEWKTPSAPVDGGIIPNAGYVSSSEDLIIKASYSDDDGIEDLSNCYLVLNKVFNGADAIYVRYDAVTDRLYLRNDKNTDWLGGYAPGSDGVMENSLCRIYCSKTVVDGTTGIISIIWCIGLKPAVIGRTYYAWQKVYDKKGMYDGWEKVGRITFGRRPYNLPFVPDSGALDSSVKTTLSSSCGDQDGIADIRGCYVLLNTVFTGAKAAYVCYSENLNCLYIRNDANTAWLGGITPGTPVVIENSQCKIYYLHFN